MDNLALFSLIFLIAVLVIGFIKKVNMGFLAMGSALIIARIGGITDNQIIGHFNTKLFITLVGPAFLFSMAVANGTMDLLSKKLIKLCGKKTWLLTPIIGCFTFLLSASGSGNIPAFSIVLPMSIALACQIGVDPIAMGLIVTLAANLGCMSPIANGGIIMSGLVDPVAAGSSFSWSIFGMSSIVWFIFMITFYFVYKMYKPENSDVELYENVPAFERNQKLTILACIAVVIAVFAFKVSIALAAPLAGIILNLIGATDGKGAIKIMPWGTYMLICGVNMLMGIVSDLGGIDVLVKGLTSVMNSGTATPIMALTSGIMSWFSSTTGVVLPTLIPTIPGITSEFAGTSFSSFAAGITITSFLAAFSPASTGGAGIMAQYILFNEGKKEINTNKVFTRLFLTSVSCVVISTLISFVGLYGII